MDEKVHSDIMDTEDSENIIINKVDGLPNLHSNLDQLDYQYSDERNCDSQTAKTLEDLVNDEDLPMSVIVTNLDPRVFKSDELKVKLFLFNVFNFFVKNIIIKLLFFCRRN